MGLDEGFEVATFGWLFLLLAAPFVGSFLGVLATRLPQEKSFVFGRSACPRCGHQLSARDLVPILSWAAQRGRCRYCGEHIEWFYPLMEVAALLIAISAVLVFSGWQLWVSCLFGWMLLAIAATDYLYMIVPDRLALPLIPAGLTVAYFAEPDSLAQHALAAAIGYLAFFAIARLYRWLRKREGLGMGDAKLLAASGAWVSIIGLPSVVFLGAATALLCVLAARTFGRQFSSHDPLPFGTFLCLATWLVWLALNWS
jgi:leader peptidase (prepilin peptidase)/N-methyltransferase